MQSFTERFEQLLFKSGDTELIIVVGVNPDLNNNCSNLSVNDCINNSYCVLCSHGATPVCMDTLRGAYDPSCSSKNNL
jgi:hypothetical protein